MLTQQDVINAAIGVMMEHYDREEYVRVFGAEVYTRYGVEARKKEKAYYLHDPLVTCTDMMDLKKLKFIHQQIDICILMHSASKECVDEYEMPAWVYGVEPPCHRWLYQQEAGVYEAV